MRSAPFARRTVQIFPAGNAEESWIEMTVMTMTLTPTIYVATAVIYWRWTSCSEMGRKFRLRSSARGNRIRTPRYLRDG